MWIGCEWGPVTDDVRQHTCRSHTCMTVICGTHPSAGESPNCYDSYAIGTCRWDLILGTKGFDSG